MNHKRKLQHLCTRMLEPSSASAAPAMRLRTPPPSMADREEGEEDDDEEEESGWTSYLETQPCPSLSFTCLHDHRSHGSTDDDDEFQTVPLSKGFRSHGSISKFSQNGKFLDEQELGGGRRNDRKRERDMVDFPDEESCGSSTLSDANYSPCVSVCRSSKCKRRRRLNTRSPNLLPSDNPLEDTATSSPSSPQSCKGKEAETPWTCGEADVVKKFKALEVFIPSLRELVGKAKEEEMLNAIISHVQALELKVQLLSDIWRLANDGRRTSIVTP